jgi:hypothetical protein
MRARAVFCFALLLVAFALADRSFAAARCEGTEPSAWTADSAEDAKLCLADQLKTLPMKQCNRPLCPEIEAWRHQPRERIAAQASPLLAKVRDSIAKVAEQFPEARPLHREIDRWSKDMAQATPEDLRSRDEGPYRTESVQHWQYVSGKYKVLDGQANEIDLGSILDRECAQGEARCTRALRVSGEVIVHAEMARTIAGALLKDFRQDAAAYVDLLAKRWDKYFDTSRFQYPWELAINDRRYRTGGRAGFVSPPEDQWIVMHPSAGLRYNSKGAQNFEPMLVLEVAGLYRWKWNGAEQENLQGGSFILAWTNQQGERKPGWGFVMYRPSNYSIGFIRHTIAGTHTTSLIASADVAKLFQDKTAVKRRLLGLLD